MTEFYKRATLGSIPKVIYFTESILNLNIQNFYFAKDSNFFGNGYVAVKNLFFKTMDDYKTPGSAT